MLNMMVKVQKKNKFRLLSIIIKSNFLYIQSPDNHYSSADNIHVNTTNGVSSGSYTISQPSVTMSQAMLHGLTGSQEFHQQQQPHHYYIQQTDVGGGGGGHSRGGMNQGQLQQSPHHLPHHNKIPDIVFNGQYYGGKDWFITFFLFLSQSCLLCILLRYEYCF